MLVDAVVTDKKGELCPRPDAKRFQGLRRQQGTERGEFFLRRRYGHSSARDRRRYLILFFDNSTMAAPDQIQARAAAKKFIDGNAGPDKLMAVVDFGGTLRSCRILRRTRPLAAGGRERSEEFLRRSQRTGSRGSGVGRVVADVESIRRSIGTTSPFSSMSNAEADFGARSMLLSLRSLAKNLRGVPGRKMVVLFSAGFPLTSESESELTATIDACNKANVAIYSLDVRGLRGHASGWTVRGCNLRTTEDARLQSGSRNRKQLRRGPGGSVFVFCWNA